MGRIIKAAAIAAFAFICISVKADEITMSQARSYADEFFGAGICTPVYGTEFYVFNNSRGGWVIISAEDATYPVLAYNPEGAFRIDGMPDNLKSWLGTIETEIRNVRSRGIKADANVRAAWRNIGLRTKASSEKVLETAEWNQGEPFNYYCPSIQENGKSVKTITGCVATAMAITMRYHMWPPCGKGTLESYSYTSDVDEKKVNVTGFSIDSHNYKYEDMPLDADEVDELSLSAQKNLAQLLYDCGVMVKAEFNGETGTAAYSSAIIPALVSHMQYSGKAREFYRSNFGLDTWINMLKDEIEAGRPVIYGAQDPEQGGHQFVIDGYDANDYMHVNWGWSGGGNGFFAIKYLSGNGMTFSDEQSGIFYLEPDRDGSDTDIMPLLTFESFGLSRAGLSVSGTVARGETFKVSCSYIWNNSPADYNGAVRLALVDKDGTVKEVISDEIEMFIDGIDNNYYSESFKNVECRFECETALGDAICLFYKLPSGDWVPMLYGKEDSFLGCYPIYDACFINVPATLTAGDTYTMELTRGQRATSSVKWYYDGKLNKDQQTVLKSGKHTIKAVIKFADGGSETLVQEIIVN